MTSLLLTGGSGFIGGALRHTLSVRGYAVTATSNGNARDGLVPCDLRDPDAVARVVRDTNPDVVVHCAALSSVTSNKTIDYYATNVVGTENLLKALGQLDKRVRFLFTSTAGVYGNQPISVLSEDLPALPVHHYGLSKLACEQMIRNVAGTMDMTIVRPFNIIGIGQDRTFVVPKIVTAFARQQRELVLGNVDVERDYIEIETACAIIADLLASTSSFGATVNLCSGKSTSLRFLIETVQDLAGYEIEVRQSPEFIRASEVWRLVGSRERLDGLLPSPIQFRPLRDTLLGMLRAFESEFRVTA